MLSDRKKGEQGKFPVPSFLYFLRERESSLKGRKMESRIQSLNVMLLCSLCFLLPPDRERSKSTERKLSIRIAICTRIDLMNKIFRWIDSVLLFLPDCVSLFSNGFIQQMMVNSFSKANLKWARLECFSWDNFGSKLISEKYLAHRLTRIRSFITNLEESQSMGGNQCENLYLKKVSFAASPPYLTGDVSQSLFKINWWLWQY